MEIKVTVANTTIEAFEAAMKLVALDVTRYDKTQNKMLFAKCDGYIIKDNILFLSRAHKAAVKFPYEYNLQQMIDFAWGWWESNKKPTGREPDTDGDTKVAWEITTENCGWRFPDYGVFVSVKPVWFIYGK